jgi:hypothetical protein
MQIGDLIKHINDGEIGIIIDYDASICNPYKVKWPRWLTTGWYTPDRLVSLKKINFFLDKPTTP